MRRVPGAWPGHKQPDGLCARGPAFGARVGLGHLAEVTWPGSHSRGHIAEVTWPGIGRLGAVSPGPTEKSAMLHSDPLFGRN